MSVLSAAPASFYLDAFPPPLDVAGFDALVSAAFALSRSEVAITARLDDAVGPAVLALGVRLLGSRGLVERVCEVLGEGLAEGDLVLACDVLYDLGVLDLGPSALCVLKVRGLR